jgi:hypothetical protein
VKKKLARWQEAHRVQDSAEQIAQISGLPAGGVFMENSGSLVRQRQVAA